MYAVLAEDDSDVDTLTVLIRRMADDHRIPVRGRGFGGCGDLLKNGARELGLYAHRASRFIVCHDCDSDEQAERREKIFDKVIKPSRVSGQFCALVPVRAIESWMLADLAAVKRVLTGWEGAKPIQNPEGLDDPKHHLEKMTRKNGIRPRYINAIHNPQIANHVDIGRVRGCCPSFEPLYNLVIKGVGNFESGS